MANADGQAFMDQTIASLIQINNKLGLLRTDQDAATATVMSITEDVAAFKAEQRVATTAHAERVQNEFASQRNEINQLQAQLAALDLS